MLRMLHESGALGAPQVGQGRGWWPWGLIWGPGLGVGGGNPRGWSGTVRAGGTLMTLKKGAQRCSVHVNNYV